MHIQNTGAPQRAPFFHFLQARARQAQAASARRSATLSDQELRRIVATMVD